LTFKLEIGKWLTFDENHKLQLSIVQSRSFAVSLNDGAKLSNDLHEKTVPEKQFSVLRSDFNLRLYKARKLLYGPPIDFSFVPRLPKFLNFRFPLYNRKYTIFGLAEP